MSAPSPKVAIILLNWNGKKDTLECLASLKSLSYPNYQIIIVDNGSTDDSVSAIHSAHPHIPILETHANLGFAGGNNVGIEWALRHHAEWILLLNNDTTVDPSLLTALLTTANLPPHPKIIGAKILRYQEPTTIDHFGGFWNPSRAEFTSPDSGLPNHAYLKPRAADYVCGAAFFFHRSVPETIGLLETRYFLFWEETDYCTRAKQAGFHIWTTPQAIIWHKVSSSFTGGKPHTHYFWWRSRLLFIHLNCTPQQKRTLYRTVLLPEMAKLLRHYFVRSLFTFGASRPTKLRHYKAGLAGIFDYYRGKFGNCPSWLLKR